METLIEEAHDINIPVIKYNDENSLACGYNACIFKY